MDTGVLNTSDGNAPQTERYGSNFLTRNMATASGTQVITGLGFQPSHILCLACTDGGVGASWGFDSGSTRACMRDESVTVDNQYGSGNSAVEIRPSPGNNYTAPSIAMNSDGFTITWVRGGTPTGNIRLHYIAFK